MEKEQYKICQILKWALTAILVSSPVFLQAGDTINTTDRQTENLRCSAENTWQDDLASIEEKIKEQIEEFGSDIARLQEYLIEQTKSLLKDRTDKGITLHDLMLNGKQPAIVVKPGDSIFGRVDCQVDENELEKETFYRVLVGFNDQETAPTSILNIEGDDAKTTTQNFVLVAPKDPGIYRVAFKTIEQKDRDDAFESWTNEEAKNTKTVGFIVVRE